MNFLSYALSVDPHWAIHPLRARQIESYLDSVGIDVIQALRPEAEARRRGASADERDYEVVNGAAIIPVSGPLTKHETCASWLYGGTATSNVRRYMRSAAREIRNGDEINRICLLIESPGGQVTGTDELADEIWSLRQTGIRVDAYVSGMAASAAYWIASQCEHIGANPAAQIGSIGTYMVLQDTSEYAGKLGVKVHVVREGEFKGAGAGGTKITDEQLAEFQREVHDLNAIFLSTVARGRGFSPEQAKSLNDGRVHVAEKALKMGLIDQVCSFDNFLTSLSTTPTPPATSRKASKGDDSTMEFTPEQEASLVDKITAKLQGLFAGRQSDPAKPDASKPTTEDAPAPAADSATDKNIDALTALVQNQAKQIETLTSANAQRDETVRIEKANARIEAAVRDMKLMPSEAKGFAELAESNAVAFDAAIKAVEAFTPAPQVVGFIPAESVAAGAGDATKEADKLAKELQAKNPQLDYTSALSQVFNADRELARRVREEQNAAAGEGSN